MTVISIVGTSGVGKSFLTKQLASLTSCPAFFEGEEGTISKKILKQVVSNSNPVERWKFFMKRYSENLSNARKISESGIDCFVDGGIITAYSILAYEDKKYRKELEEIIDKYKHLESDIIILLVASEEYLKKAICSRNRTDEQNNVVLQRAMKIQKKFLRLAKKYNVVIIERTNLDFKKESDFQKIVKKIRKHI